MPIEFILIAAALVVFVLFQIRSSRKRARDTAERQATIVPGVEIMTNYGLYGMLLDLDEEENIALIETTPGTVLKIHRQTILKAVEEDETPEASDELPESEPVVESTDDAAQEAIEPEFGERIDPDAKKPARKSNKKATE